MQRLELIVVKFNFYKLIFQGYFTVEEIVDFQQTDLIEDDVMLLDAGDTIFLWIGEQSNDEERKFSRNLVAEYMKTDPSQRDEDTPLIIIKQGYEPPNFTGNLVFI